MMIHLLQRLSDYRASGSEVSVRKPCDMPPRGVSSQTIPAAVAFCAMVAGFFLGGQAVAQSWYPGECCAEYDCFNEPVARDLVERRHDGWFLKKEQRVIPFDMTRPSPDGKFHICRNEMGKGSIIIPNNRPACLWAPEGEG